VTRERLQRLRLLLGEALALPDAEREAFVAEAAANDGAIGAELVALLAAAQADDARFEPLLAEAPDEAPLAADQRLGPWRLVERLGTGGMGEVWLAARADGAYAHEVAIKLPRTSARGPTAFARFERERALLAELEHPGIARLIDGGWTPTGRPWLAMERVEGRAIDEHAAALGLSARERVRLLVAACRALAAAHRSRIVHRDLKPSNVLVRADGVVVIVDFGIAAALDRAPTPALAYLATPRYSAPEQLRGEPATTAVDVWSLAVLGRELLGTGADDDLRAVFAAATEPDAGKRTPSADALAADLQRWLDDEPVLARPPSALHRLRLWRRRAPKTVAAVAALAIAVLGLLATTTTLWRAERAERQRAATAQAAQAQRFAQVRELVNHLVFGVHDRIATLPGAVPVRAFVLERAEQHLALLAADAEQDAALAREWIGAQLRLAEVRGTRQRGHVGDQAGAMRSATAAVLLATAWQQRQPTEESWARLVARGRWLTGDLQRALGRLQDARAEYEAARALLPDTGRGGDDTCRLRGVLELQLAKVELAQGAAERALVRLASAVTDLDALVAKLPDEREARRDGALARSEQGYALSQLGRDAEAAAAWTTAHEQLTALVAAHPSDAQLARDLLEVEIELAVAASGPDAPMRAERALAAARAQLAADTANVMAQRTLQRALLRTARAAAARRDHALAAARYREAEPLLVATHALLAEDHATRIDLAEALIGRAEADRTRGAGDDVAHAFEAGLALLDADAALAAGDHFTGNLLTMAWVGLANLELAGSDLPAARRRIEPWCARAAAWAERFPDLPWPLRHLGAFEYAFGTLCEALAADAARPVASRLADLQSARDAFARGLAAAERLAAAGRLRGADAAIPGFFAKDLARVDAARAELVARQDH